MILCCGECVPTDNQCGKSRTTTSIFWVWTWIWALLPIWISVSEKSAWRDMVKLEIRWGKEREDLFWWHLPSPSLPLEHVWFKILFFVLVVIIILLESDDVRRVQWGYNCEHWIHILQNRWNHFTSLGIIRTKQLEVEIYGLSDKQKKLVINRRSYVKS